MNTRMTILSPRRDTPSAPLGSGLARTRRQNSAENRGRHRVERSLRVRSTGSRSLPPGLQIKKLSGSLPPAGSGGGGGEGGGEQRWGMMGVVVSTPPCSAWSTEFVQVLLHVNPSACRWLEGSPRRGKGYDKGWRGCQRDEKKEN